MLLMKRARTGWVLSMAVLFLWLTSSQAVSQEHPEHPTKTTLKPKPEVTKEMMAQAITGYINKDTEMKGGYFLVYDPQDKKPLTLTLEKVHQDKLSQVGENLFFACTDLKSTDGKTYDLDFFMKGMDSGLSVSEIMIHKVDGTPRYSWYEEEGIWKRKEVSKK